MRTIEVDSLTTSALVAKNDVISGKILSDDADKSTLKEDRLSPSHLLGYDVAVAEVTSRIKTSLPTSETVLEVNDILSENWELTGEMSPIETDVTEKAADWIESNEETGVLSNDDLMV